MKHGHVLLLLIPLVLAACGGPRSYSRNEDFQGDPRHRRDFSQAAEPLCDAARRVLLGEGYLVESEASALTLAGAKEFREEDNRHGVLRLHINCAERSGGATLFVTATEELFEVKTNRQSTAVGLPLLSPISVHSKSESEGPVKIGGETVSDRNFYEGFYRAVQREWSR